MSMPVINLNLNIHPLISLIFRSMPLSNIDESKSKSITALYPFLDFSVLITTCDYIFIGYDFFNAGPPHQTINFMCAGPYLFCSFLSLGSYVAAPL